MRDTPAIVASSTWTRIRREVLSMTSRSKEVAE